MCGMGVARIVMPSAGADLTTPTAIWPDAPLRVSTMALRA